MQLDSPTSDQDSNQERSLIPISSKHEVNQEGAIDLDDGDPIIELGNMDDMTLAETDRKALIDSSLEGPPSPIVTTSSTKTETTNASFTSLVDYTPSQEIRLTMVTRGAMGIRKPNPKYTLTVQACEIAIPRSLKQALSYHNWNTPGKTNFKP